MTRRRQKRPAEPAVDYAGNTWSDCVGGVTVERLDALAVELQQSLPAGVRDLLRHCAGGSPQKAFYESPERDIEVGVGYVLVVDTHRTKTSVAQAVEWIWEDGTRNTTIADGLIPVAVDNGNAHFLCVDPR